MNMIQMTYERYNELIRKEFVYDALKLKDANSSYSHDELFDVPTSDEKINEDSNENSEEEKEW